jgi:hypothetical protein
VPTCSPANALLWVTWDEFRIPAALATKIVKPQDLKICILVASDAYFLSFDKNLPGFSSFPPLLIGPAGQ